MKCGRKKKSFSNPKKKKSFCLLKNRPFGLSHWCNFFFVAYALVCMCDGAKAKQDHDSSCPTSMVWYARWNREILGSEAWHETTFGGFFQLKINLSWEIQNFVCRKDLPSIFGFPDAPRPVLFGKNVQNMVGHFFGEAWVHFRRLENLPSEIFSHWDSFLTKNPLKNTEKHEVCFWKFLCCI